MVVFARKEAGQLDLAAAEAAGGLPRAFLDVMSEDALRDVRIKQYQKADLHGDTLEWWNVDGGHFPASLFDMEFGAQAIWTNSVLVMRFSFTVRRGNNPRPVKSIFR